MAKPTLHLPGEGENHEMGASRISLKATAEAWSRSDGPPDPATIGEIASRHDFEVV